MPLREGIITIINEDNKTYISYKLNHFSYLVISFMFGLAFFLMFYFLLNLGLIWSLLIFLFFFVFIFLFGFLFSETEIRNIIRSSIEIIGNVYNF
jgi:hypothetical protein